ncbi:MAG: hypothetical protein K2H26_04020 [Ruminococcus sp.]|nr:hypothetical protein [Ruminococcus sp.]
MEQNNKKSNHSPVTVIAVVCVVSMVIYLVSNLFGGAICDFCNTALPWILNATGLAIYSAHYAQNQHDSKNT